MKKTLLIITISMIVGCKNNGQIQKEQELIENEKQLATESPKITETEIIAIQSDLYKMKLKGNVKKIQTSCYEANVISSEILKGKKIESQDHGLAQGLEEYDNDIINFNEKGNIIEKLSRLFGKHIYTYDDKGNKIQHLTIDPKGTVESKTTYQYDNYNNLLEENYYDYGAKLNSKTLYEFDKKGNIILETHFEGNLLDMKKVNKYDNKDDKIETKLFDKSGVNYRTFSYIYDNRHNILKETVNDSHISTLYEYDNNNIKVKQTEMDDSGKNAIKSTTNFEYTYDQAGNIIKKIYFVDNYPIYIVEFKIEYFESVKF